MHCVIAGAGSVGRSIASELISHAHQVTLLDSNPEAMKVASISKAEWILGDACSPQFLQEVGLETCDVMVAATGDDKANLVMSLLAKTEFGVPRVVARVNNPKNEWMFDESWGVDVCVSTPRTITSRVEQAVSVGTLVSIFQFSRSNIDMHSVLLPPDAPIINTRLDDTAWPAHVMLCAILRDGRPFHPQENDVFLAGDELLLLVSSDSQEQLKKLETMVASPK